VDTTPRVKTTELASGTAATANLISLPSSEFRDFEVSEGFWFTRAVVGHGAARAVAVPQPVAVLQNSTSCPPPTPPGGAPPAPGTHCALCFSFLQRDFRIKPAHNQKDSPQRGGGRGGGV